MLCSFYAACYNYYREMAQQPNIDLLIFTGMKKVRLEYVYHDYLKVNNLRADSFFTWIHFCVDSLFAWIHFCADPFLRGFILCIDSCLRGFIFSWIHFSIDSFLR